jgi:Xaa-Pro aminopeptidase
MTEVVGQVGIGSTELNNRLARVVEIMHDLQIRGLLIYSDAGNAGNVRYLTNYRPFFGLALLVLRNDGERILVNNFNWDAPRARLGSDLDRIYSGFDTGRLTAGAVDALGLAASDPLGIVGADLMPFELHEAIFETGGRPPPVDARAPYERLRLVKSPVEQEMLRQAAAVTDAAIAATVRKARAGISELELAAFVEYEMKRGGADGFAFPASVASGPNTEKPVSLPGSRRLEPGDLVMLDVGATCEGYCADVTRTFVVGEPSSRQREVYEVVADALAQATQAAQPGVPAAELHRIAVEVLAAHDLDRYFTHRAGHGIGLETSLEAPDLQRHDTPLEPGMTFCIEPGVYIPGFGGIKIEDDVIVGSHGPEVISNSGRELVSV